MDIYALRMFFMWCTIINGLLLVISALFCLCGADWVYRMHSKWFPISRNAFNVAMYGFLGFFKILVLIFNLVPYLALLILG